jgi:hypothetical protein
VAMLEDESDQFFAQGLKIEQVLNRPSVDSAVLTLMRKCELYSCIDCISVEACKCDNARS